MVKEKQQPGIDSLTKLWTEDSARELIENDQKDRRICEGDIFYLIYLDGWQEVKQNYNPETRNSVLQQVAFLLGKQFGDLDVIARIGENVFLAYEIGCRSLKAAEKRTEDLNNRLQNIYFLREHEELNIGIGAVWCHGEIKEYPVILKEARYAVKCALDDREPYKIVEEGESVWKAGSPLVAWEKAESYNTLSGQADIEFITELTDTLFLCNDIVIGIEMSLERLCRYYEVEYVGVVERSSDREYFETTYEYQMNNLRVINDNLKYIPAFFVRDYEDGFDENGICVCNTLRALKQASRVMAEREKLYGTKAVMQSAIMENGEFTGYISLCDLKAERLWSRKEIITYLMASKIITASILRMRSLKYTMRITYKDLLTEAWNKNKFLIEAARKPDKPDRKKAVVTFDLKNFKVINREFGYDIGNEVLIEISNLLSMFVDRDECYARLEADTFVLLLYYPDRAELEARVQRLLNHVEHMSARLELIFPFVCMAGICTEEESGLEIREMIECADMVRKSIKDYHKSSYKFFNHDAQKRRDREKYITSRMKKALRDEEFIVYYQPRVDVRTGEYISMEALARWQPPGEEIIMPDDFIPLFEQNGFILELDLYVFEQVCREIHKWMMDGRKLYPVAVNISRVHIKEVHFMEQLERICQKYGVPEHLIELELTESAFLNNPEIIMDAALKIKEKGFQLSMDDFGTGFSSLSMLKDIPVDIIKLDRTFFQKRMSKREKIIISHVIHMAKELQIEIVSEGIETKEHEQFLKEIGCDVAQGFLYARPEPLCKHEAKLWK